MRYRGTRASRWPLLLVLFILVIAVVAVALYLNLIPH
jgi:hypothetical protein